jgi:BolA protein
MMNAQARITLIRDCLERELTPDSLEIIDDSHHHVGHASARGGGHFTINIVSPIFQGKKPLARHRMVYAALKDAMQNEIHALSIQARTPDEG